LKIFILREEKLAWWEVVESTEPTGLTLASSIASQSREWICSWV